MEKVHILMGFELPQLEEGLKEELRRNGVEAKIAVKFKKAAIKKYVDENEDCDVVIIKERALTEKYTAEEIALLTDKRDVNVIVALSSRLYGTQYMQVLYAANITNALLQKNRDDGASARDIVELILRRRSRAQAREYYGIESTKIDLGFLDNEMYLEYHKDLSMGSGSLLENYIAICKKLSPQQMHDFTRRLPEDELNELIKYEEFHTVADMLRKVGFNLKIKRPKKVVIGLKIPAQIGFRGDDVGSTDKFPQESATVEYSDVYGQKNHYVELSEPLNEEALDTVRGEEVISDDMSLEDILAMLDEAGTENGEVSADNSGIIKEKGDIELKKEKATENLAAVHEEPLLSEEEVKKKYWIDPVTRLYNRAAFEKNVLNVDIDKLVIISIDANDLKVVNDTEGHEAGDKMLKNIADSAVEVWGDEKCYRVGGDEFAIVLEGIGRERIKEYITRFKELLEGFGHTAAVGYADGKSVEGNVTIEKICKASDEAMYMDKNLYKEVVRRAQQAKYDAEKKEEEEARKAEVEALLRDADETHQKELEKLQKEHEETEKKRVANTEKELKKLNKIHEKEVSKLKTEQKKLQKELKNKEKQVMAMYEYDEDEDEDAVLYYSDRKFSFGFVILMALIVILVMALLFLRPMMSALGYF